MKHIKRVTSPAPALDLGQIFAGLNIASIGLWVNHVVKTLIGAALPDGPVEAGDPEDGGYWY